MKWNLTHNYSRSEALAGGELVDVSEMAREAGFRFPVAVTAAVWRKHVAGPEGDVNERIRLVLSTLQTASRGQRAKEDPRTVRFQVHLRGDDREPSPVTLKAECGPGDNAEPVISVMLVDEE